MARLNMRVSNNAELAELPNDDPEHPEDGTPSSKLLLDELPDPNQQLLIQMGKGTETFTYFPELPSEIRLNIWRFCFPRPRAVNLFSTCQGLCVPIATHPLRVVSESYRTAAIRKCLKPLPTTLHISVESRQETLKFHSVVYPPHSPQKEYVLKVDKGPVCLDTQRDLVFFNNCSFQRNARYSDGRLGFVKAQAPGLLAKIRRLEIRRFVRNAGLRRALILYTAEEYGTIRLITERLQLHPHCGIIRVHWVDFAFPALTEIHVVMHLNKFRGWSTLPQNA